MSQEPSPTPVAVESSYVPVPSRVAMAMNFIGWAEAVRLGQPNRFDGTPCGGRELAKNEYEVYDSALTVLLSYFNESDVPQVEPTPLFTNQRPPEPPQPTLAPKI